MKMALKINTLALLVIGVLFLLPLMESAYSSHEIVGGTPKVMNELVVKSEPRGILITGSSMYESNTWAETGIAPASSGSFEFAGWKVDGEWYIGNPITVLMDADHSAVAIYSLVHGDLTPENHSSNKHYLTIISPYGNTTGSGWYIQEKTADFAVSEKYVYDDFRDGIRYAFNGWDDGKTPNLLSNSIIMNESKVVTANWTKQYRLDFVNSSAEVNLLGSGWHDEGSLASLTAIDNSELDKTIYTFKEWLNAGPNAAIIENSNSSSTSIAMENSYLIMAVWQEQYYLDINSGYGKVEGDGYYDAGTYAKSFIGSEIQETGKAGVRLAFDGWDGDANSQSMNVKVFMDSPKSIDANWEKQYYLTINSEWGNPYGSDWYDGGQIANFGINIHREPAGFWNQQLFYGWDGSSKTSGMKGTVLMNEPKTIIAKWSDDSSTAFLNIGIIAALLVVASFGYKTMKKRVKSLSSQFSSDGKKMYSQDEAFQILNEYSEDRKK